MATLFAKVPYAYVWGDNNGTHKQGKAYPWQPLVVLKENKDWVKIEPLELDRKVDRSEYPDFWVRKVDVSTAIQTPPPAAPPPPSSPLPAPTVGEQEVAQAIITILKWIRSL